MNTEKGIFQKVLEIIAGPSSDIQVFWFTEYSRSLVPAEMWEHQKTKQPLVLDPIKPWNNVVRASNLKYARMAANYALRLLNLKFQPPSEERDISPHPPIFFASSNEAGAAMASLSDGGDAEDLQDIADALRDISLRPSRSIENCHDSSLSHNYFE